MNLTAHQKKRIYKFPTTDLYEIIKLIIEDVVNRSRVARKSGQTCDETHGNVRFGEGMEAGAIEVLNIINKLSQ